MEGVWRHGVWQQQWGRERGVSGVGHGRVGAG